MKSLKMIDGYEKKFGYVLASNITITLVRFFRFILISTYIDAKKMNVSLSCFQHFEEYLVISKITRVFTRNIFQHGPNSHN